MGPWEMLGLAAASVCVLLIATWIGVLLYRAVRHYPSSPRSDSDDLRARVAELEAQQARMAELEERLDFAERLLAEQRAPESLPRS